MISGMLFPDTNKFQMAHKALWKTLASQLITSLVGFEVCYIYFSNHTPVLFIAHLLQPNSENHRLSLQYVLSNFKYIVYMLSVQVLHLAHF